MNNNDNQGTTIGQRNGRAKGWLIFFGSLFGGLLGILTIWIFFTDSSTGLFETANGILFSKPRTGLTQRETLLIQQMIENGAIMTPSEVMSEVSSFYERVITILTTLIAFLGVIAYMYVRTVSEEAALKTVRDAVVSQIDSDAHKKDILEAVKSVVEPELKRRLDPKVSGLDTYMKDLDTKLEEFQEVARRMPSEDVVEDIYARISMITRHIALEDEEESGGDLNLE